MSSTQYDRQASVGSELRRIGDWAMSKRCGHYETGRWDLCRDPAASQECVRNGESLYALAAQLEHASGPEDAVERIETIADPWDRLDAACAMQDLLRELTVRVAAIRRGTMRDLVIDGHTYEEIAAHAGITRARVEQIINYRKPGDPWR